MGAVTKIRTNYDDEKLYCLYSKERIEIGEKYVEVFDEDEQYARTYKTEHAPSEEDLDDEEPWIAEDQNPEDI